MTDINVQNLLTEKKQAQEPAVRAASPIANATDERGRVKLWVISKKKWVKFWPVDAMDVLKSGTANLDGPDLEAEAEAKAKADADAKAKAKADADAKAEAEAKANAEAEAEAKAEAEEKPEPDPLENMTIPQLKKYAKKNKIDISNLDEKEILAEIRKFVGNISPGQE